MPHFYIYCKHLHFYFPLSSLFPLLKGHPGRTFYCKRHTFHHKEKRQAKHSLSSTLYALVFTLKICGTPFHKMTGYLLFMWNLSFTFQNLHHIINGNITKFLTVIIDGCKLRFTADRQF